MPLDVIGAGFGRTGTESLQKALEILGYGPCYHMSEVLKYPGDQQSWIQVAAACDAQQTPNFQVIFNRPDFQYKSAVDFPASTFYRELLQANPKAKVVLTVRDSPTSWYKSAHDTIWHVFDFRQQFPYSWMVALNPWMRESMKFLRVTIWDRIFRGQFANETAAQQVYVDWIEQVRRTVPAGQLLVFNVKEGWEPLCDFLNVPVPAQPFPRSNDKGKFLIDWHRRFRQRIYQTIASLTAGSLLAYFIIGRKLLSQR